MKLDQQIRDRKEQRNLYWAISVVSLFVGFVVGVLVFSLF